MTKAAKNGPAGLDKLALTISPPEMKLSFKDTFILHLRRLAKIESKFVIFPETDIKGRLHYHGFLWKDKYYKETIEHLEKMGFIKIKPISNSDGWLKYCKKELKVTKAILELHKKFKHIDNEYVSKYRVSNNSRDIMSYFMA